MKYSGVFWRCTRLGRNEKEKQWSKHQLSDADVESGRARGVCECFKASVCAVCV